MSEDNITNLNAARFKRADEPSKVQPRAALDATIEWLNDPNTPQPSHIIVLIGSDVFDEGCEGASSTLFFQAGTYRHHGQMGLCLEAMHMIRESGYSG